MTSTSPVKKIGILGHVGNENLGDEAIISAVIQNIKSRLPTAEICGFTIRPEDTLQRHHIAAVRLRRRTANSSAEMAKSNSSSGLSHDDQRTGILSKLKSRLNRIPCLPFAYRKFQELITFMYVVVVEPVFLVRCYQCMAGVDLLLIAGSSQLIDYVVGGAWGHPYTILKWTLLAKLRNAKVAFISCGAGPVQTRLGRLFLRLSLSIADYRSCRDEGSRMYVEKLGVSKAIKVFPDLAYGLHVDEASTRGRTSVRRPVIGINAVPFSDPKAWVGGGTVVYQAYILKLAMFARWLISRGYAVTFFPTQLRADPAVVNDLLRLTTGLTEKELRQHIVECRINSFDDLAKTISLTHMVVSTRFHGIVISYLVNKPVLGIAYAEKTHDLMKQMGQAEYVIDILSFDLAQIQERFIALEKKQNEIKVEIFERLAGFRTALAQQYEEAFDLIL